MRVGVYKEGFPMGQRLLHFTRLLLLHFSTMPALSIERTSDAVLPQYIYNLPAHLEPQPALVWSWCTACLPQFCSGNFSVSKLRGVAGKEFCGKSNYYATCEGCKARHTTCDPVSIPWEVSLAER